MADSPTEAAAKKFFDVGVDLERPASIAIYHAKAPWVDQASGTWCTRFVFFNDARLHTASKAGYTRKKKVWQTLKSYKTQAEATAHLYRDVYDYVHRGINKRADASQRQQQQQRHGRDERAAASTLRMGEKAKRREEERVAAQEAAGASKIQRKSKTPSSGRTGPSPAELLHRHAAAVELRVIHADKEIDALEGKTSLVRDGWDLLHSVSRDDEEVLQALASVDAGGVEDGEESSDGHEDDAPLVSAVELKCDRGCGKPPHPGNCRPVRSPPESESPAATTATSAPDGARGLSALAAISLASLTDKQVAKLELRLMCVFRLYTEKSALWKLYKEQVHATPVGGKFPSRRPTTTNAIQRVLATWMDDTMSLEYAPVSPNSLRDYFNFFELHGTVKIPTATPRGNGTNGC